MEMQEYNISENNFEQCIKCTICTVYCPVVPVNPDYPGPKQAGPDGERLRLKKGIFFDETLKYCLNCKRCEVACPSGVRIGDIIQAARIKYGRSKPKLRDMMLASTDLMGSVATKMAPVVNTTLKIKPVKQIMDGVLKIDHRRTFPQYASETFVRWFKKNAEARQEKFSRKVAYFHGCYANYNYPQLGKDFVDPFGFHGTVGIFVRGFVVLVDDEVADMGIVFLTDRLFKGKRIQGDLLDLANTFGRPDAA